jgi:hypothetical protein
MGGDEPPIFVYGMAVALFYFLRLRRRGLIAALTGQQDDPEIRPGSPCLDRLDGLLVARPVVARHGIGQTTGSRIVLDRDQFTCPVPELMFTAWRPAVGFPEVIGTFANALLLRVSGGCMGAAFGVV